MMSSTAAKDESRDSSPPEAEGEHTYATLVPPPPGFFHDSAPPRESLLRLLLDDNSAPSGVDVRTTSSGTRFAVVGDFDRVSVYFPTIKIDLIIYTATYDNPFLSPVNTECRLCDRGLCRRRLLRAGRLCRGHFLSTPTADGPPQQLVWTAASRWSGESEHVRSTERQP